MRTVEEVTKELDKIQERYNKLLEEKSKIQQKQTKYFKREATLIFYTEDDPADDYTLDQVSEPFDGNYDGVVILKKGEPQPISQEEYENVTKG